MKFNFISHQGMLITRKCSILLAISSLLSASILAGPPFLTDDPVPVNYQHFKIISFATGGKSNSEINIQAPAVEIDYGLIPNLEINITIPINSHLTKWSDEPNGV